MNLHILRDDILYDSLLQLKYEDIDTRHLRVVFNGEEGYDLGGLLKDWMTNVSKELLETGIFKPTPSAKYLTIDENNATKDLLFFAGQLIAIALNNNLNADINLTLFIWKLFKHEKITIEDMEEFDPLVHQSLKWILNNDVTALDEVFVDMNDEELMKNGRNIKLTNQNKQEYVKLMLKRMFLGQNTELFEFLVNGFEQEVDSSNLQLYDAIELRERINGKIFIDVYDWKNNTRYDSKDKDDVELFFAIISNWSQEKLKKLLKFATGSSLVPVNGFADLPDKLFNIEVSNDSHMYPEAHTCFNRIVLPKGNNRYELKRKLKEAIEVVDFALE